MGKLIAGLVFAGVVILLCGLYPHVAVGVTAVVIVIIFKAGEWYKE